jgi:hypothetical protein
MRIVKKILLILAIMFVLIAAIGYIFFPSHIHVQRTITINQQPAVVFNYVNDLGNWNSWSPWYLKDTAAVYTKEGPGEGVGSILSWKSNDSNVGNGSMKITESKPDSIIREELSFMEGGIAHSYYSFTPEGDNTVVTWGFDTDAGANPLGRIIGGFMDGMIGKDFESGLTRLKTITEALPQSEPMTSHDSTMVQ